jgi:type IV pilus assembly protein PilC
LSVYLRIYAFITARDSGILPQFKECHYLSGIRFFYAGCHMFYVSFQVIPHLEALLPVKANAYFSTRLLLFLSHFLKDFWFLCLLLPAGIFLIYAKLKKGSTERISSLYHRIPLLGPIAKDAALSSLFANLSVLTRSGINIVDALSLLEETSYYQFLTQRMKA